MTVPYDLAPTARLSGLHMVGTVARRFLISYPVPPESLQDYLPPGAELSTHNGMSWLSACFVHMDDMRPNVIPRCLGMGFNYLIHRTRARLPFPDGQLREAVLVLEPNINRPLLSVAGSRLTGVGFHTRRIEFTEDAESWRVRMAQGSELLFDATISKASCSNTLPQSSAFASAEAADQFLLGVSFGGQWRQNQTALKLLPETHEPWNTLTCSCVTHKHVLLESLNVDNTAADHVITMTEIPHYFGIRPIKTSV